MAVARTPFGSEMNAMTKTGFRRVALAASIGPTAAGLISISESFAQNPLPPPAPGTAEVERVIVTAEAERTIVTGSLIPTSEESRLEPGFNSRPRFDQQIGSGHHGGTASQESADRECEQHPGSE